MQEKKVELVILCGGRGRRLNPVTESIPKALVPVRGKAIVEHVIDVYSSGGVKNIIFCIGYKGQKIISHLSNKEDSYQFSDSGEDASMLLRLYKAKEKINAKRVIVAYCDTFIDLDPEEILRKHEELNVSATIITASVINPFGLVNVDESMKVSSFVEKPVQTYFIGTFILEYDAFNLIEPEMLDMPDGDGLISFFQKLISSGKLGAYQHDGMQITFNTEEELERAETELHRFYTLNEA
jgi:NDP-sugar pyrophosphorylase family protein